LGDVPADFTAAGITSDPQINIRTLQKLINSTCLAAKDTSRKYAILVRPHGRDDKDDQDALLQIQLAPEEFSRVRIINASSTAVGIFKRVFASDVVTSINSTANHLAPKRGREAIFLGFKDSGLGSEVLQETYSDSYAEILGFENGAHLAGSEAELVRVLRDLHIANASLPTEGTPNTDRLVAMIAG